MSDEPRLLELENAILRVASRYDSILREQPFEAVLAEVSKHAVFKIAGITTSDGRGAYRALILSRTGPIMPYRARLPSSPKVFETVYQRCQPLYVRTIDADDPVAPVARSVGLGSYTIYPIPNADGRVLGAFYFGFDQPDGNDAIRAEVVHALTSGIAGSLERSVALAREHRALRILEASEDAMLAWDADGRVTDINAAAERMVEDARGSIIGAPIAEFLGVIPSVVAHGQRMQLTTRTGRRVPVTATVSLVESDPLVAAHALLRDESSLVAAEIRARAHLAELKKLSEQHTLLLDNAPLVIFRLDPVTNELAYLNRHAERLFGVRAAEALATPGFLKMLHLDPDGRAAFERSVEAAKRGEPCEPYEARLGLAPKSNDPRAPATVHDPIIARGIIYPITESGADEPVQRLGVEGVLLDVTTERAARSRLIQADRLATVGMLAAGVAHEINNPAAFMMIGLDTLVRLLRGPSVEVADGLRETLDQLIEDLRVTSRRIVEIARDMRLFAHPPSTEAARVAPIDVGRAIESALTITRAQIVEHAEVELDVTPDLPPVLMEEGRLGQVLVSVLINAAQAIAEARETRPRRRETVRVVARFRPSEAPVDAEDAGRIEIVIEDTGIGMSPAVLDRLFKPFFTTKGPQRGTGLGLAIARGILERAGGQIDVTSPGTMGDPPCGTRVRLELPALGEGVMAVLPARGLKSSSRARVLLVEDEPLLRKGLAEQLSVAHDITSCAGGAEALDRLASSHFDAVLCDLRMPGMSGEAFYRRVEIEHPYLARRFIFMTGVGFGEATESFIQAVRAPMLEKPFPMDEALAKIASVLEPPESARAAR